MWKIAAEYLEVNEDGDVRSTNREVRCKAGTRKVIGKVLKQGMHHNGYKKIATKYHGKPKTYLVHRLVAEAFIDNPDNKPHVNHIDGNKMNNHKSNLEWVTPSENMRHAVATKLQPLTIKINTDVRDTIAILYPYIKLSNVEIGKLFNVSGTTIHNIIKERSSEE